MTELPEAFISQLHKLGLDSLPDALSGGTPVVSLRLNPAKAVTAGMLPFEVGEQVPWCPAGHYLPERPRFTADPLLHQGAYYVQEASSMFHSHVVGSLSKNSSAPLRLLDACAAPGGKTTAAISALPEGSLVVANEFVPSRAAVLRENIIKWSYPSCVVTRGDTASFGRLKECFDIIIADVPCSGEGMMRKDAEAVAQWSPSLVAECAGRQWEIVTNLWPALKPGGAMVYSTCTFNRSENEDIVERIISEFGAESVEIPVDPAWGITGAISTDAFCYRFMPDRLKGEGLFVAVLRKSGAPRADKDSKTKRQKSKPSPLLSQASSWINPNIRENFEIYADGDRINAFPAIHMDMLKRIKKETDVIHEGVVLASVKGKDLIPSHSLALSPITAPNAFPEAELTRDEAIAYLSGEAVTLPDGAPRGFIILTYSSLPLGFVKNIGRRSNNLYPAPWRIRSNFKN